MVKLLEFLARHTARHLFRSSHLKAYFPDRMASTKSHYDFKLTKSGY